MLGSFISSKVFEVLSEISITMRSSALLRHLALLTSTNVSTKATSSIFRREVFFDTFFDTFFGNIGTYMSDLICALLHRPIFIQLSVP
jgi:hypothetical protein